MPPFGLYPMSRHHLYGTAQAPRRKYNSLSFEDVESDKPSAIIEEAAHVVNSLKDGKAETVGKKGKHKKKDPMESAVKRQTKEEKPADPRERNSKVEDVKEKSKKRRKTDDTPATPTKKQKKHKEAKNNKTETASHDANHATSSSFFASSDAWLHDVKSSVGDVATLFGSPGTPVPQALARKLKKSKSCSAVGDKRSAKTPEFNYSRVTTERLEKSTQQQPQQQLTKQKHPPVGQEANAAPMIANSVRDQHTSLTVTPRQTPIPVPNQSSVIQKKHKDSAQRHESSMSEIVLVSETPPSKMHSRTQGLVQTPIPINSFHVPSKVSSEKKRDKAPTILLSSPSTVDSDARYNATFKARQPSTQASLTVTNLQRYMEPLNDTPKPRLHSRAVSVALSSTSSSPSTTSSMNILEAFARARRTSTTSDQDDVFSSSTLTKRLHSQRETHEEANIDTFNACFHASRLTVNFTDEQHYLHQYLTMRYTRTTLGASPCLKLATGCSSKGEQILRLAREDPSHLLTTLGSNTKTQTAFDDAVRHAQVAEHFLANAIQARVPIPLGSVEGVYTLYCPSYSAIHIDKYATQRTISISRPSGFASNSTYVARMSIPPRSMAYTILAFDGPPHASFRSTTAKTAVEGYELEIVFLGNGYIGVNMDLGCLLRGKKDGKGEEGVMGFFGVREVDGRGRDGKVEWVGMEGGGEGEEIGGREGVGNGGEKVVKKKGRQKKVLV